MTRTRCNLGWAQNVPMLNDAEFGQVMDQLSRIKEESYVISEKHGCSFDAAAKRTKSGQRALKLYKQMTGRQLDDPMVLYSVKQSKWGRPCPQCAQAFATPNATLCVRCGYQLQSGDVAGPA